MVYFCIGTGKQTKMKTKSRRIILFALAAILSTSGIQAERNLSASISAGSTGIGIGIGTRMNELFGIRGGYDFVPHFTKDLSFTMTTGTDYNDEKAQIEKFNSMTGKLKELTGIGFDRRIDMKAEPSFHNFNIVADFHPIEKNRNWRVSAGIYWSFSKTIGRAENANYDSPALVSVNMYNSLYERALYSYEYDEIWLRIEDMNLYASEKVYKKFYDWGKMGMFVGDSVNGGGSYIMTPDENCTVSARMTTNKIKPYLGIGYEGPLIKGNDMYSLSFDLGMLFWGGSPDVITHEGVDIAHDLTDLNGQIRNYIRTSNKLKVYPLIKVSISRRIF